MRFLNAEDEEVTSYEGIDVVQVYIRSSKTDQNAEGVHLRLGGQESINSAQSMLPGLS